jgi:hypothetical protein
MIILDSRREAGEMEVPEAGLSQVPSGELSDESQDVPTKGPKKAKEEKEPKGKAPKKDGKAKAAKSHEENPEDSEEIPF